MACVDIQALPLQLLLRRHPNWKARPVVVVERDKPLGVILWANEQARAQRILPGMRYATGLSLSPELRGAVVSDADLDAATARITQRLWCFSPQIEPSPDEAGVFWLDASGLQTLYPSLEGWAACIRDDLRDTGFEAVVAVGFSRFGSYAATRTHSTVIVFSNPEEERAHLHKVPIVRLGLEPSFRDILLKLGVDTLGRFLELPAAGIRKRFGVEADALYRRAKGDGWAPLNPCALFEPVERTELLEYPETDLDRLLLRLSFMVQSLLRELANEYEAFKSLRISLTLDDGREQHEDVSPAVPTRDTKQLLSLIRLRLETVSLSSGVVEVTVRVVGETVDPHQLELFREASRQNLEAAHRAFANIRAELGSDAVVYARLSDGHLPEARYGWEPLDKLTPPKPTEVAIRPLVRRVYSPPIALPSCDRHDPDGWLIAGVAEGPVEEVIGPQLISGGWWMREVSRAYHYVRTQSGRWLWIYYDHKRRRWFLQGEVQ